MVTSIIRHAFISHGQLSILWAYFHIQDDKGIQAAYRSICDNNKKDNISGYQHDILSPFLINNPDCVHFSSPFDNLIRVHTRDNKTKTIINPRPSLTHIGY